MSVLWRHASEQEEALSLWTFRFSPQNQMDPVILSRLLPYLDNWNMSCFDPYVSDLVWSMDDSRHGESISKDLSEDHMDQLQLFADANEPGCRHRWRTSAPASSADPAPSVPELTGRDPTINEKFSEPEIKRQRQGLQMNEASSSEQLNITSTNLARQTIQREAEPRMLHMLMNKMSHIMILVEGSPLTVNQWDSKLRAREWGSCSLKMMATIGSGQDNPPSVPRSRTSRRSGTPSLR